MLFNSLSYLLFLLLAAAIYWVLPRSRRIWLLLIASLTFYALWRPEFVLLVMFSAFVDFWLALKISREKRPLARTVWLLCSLASNLALLGYFKYAYFVLGNVSAVGTLLGRSWTFDPGAIVLPLGISFYTFVSVSYTVDVYRRLYEPSRNYFVYLTYVMFWPHMIAGPIMRAHELVPQLTGGARFDAERCAIAVRTILFGLFLKVALADQIAPQVDEAFAANPATLSALDVWTMAFAFGLQIYFDFAGYSMIAIGSAGLLGIRFPENFDWPYLATSPREFWKRWHITLSSWIRDYLYLPLCGVRFEDRSAGGLEIGFVKPSSLRLTSALFLTWFLMGLWHGAAWTFALWGLWHATFIWLYRLIAPRAGAVPVRAQALLGWGATLAIVMLGWIPFRARTLADAFELLGRLFDWRAYGYLSFRESFYFSIASVLTAVIGAYFVGMLVDRTKSSLLRQVVEVISIAVAGFFVVIFLRPITQFIYFQF
jgi:D-alanyl-lipoteichoic acid acyltransferase DltB (MBOAT superfamily)